METNIHLELKDIRKSFPSGESELTILHGVDFTVIRGESVAITGPSGSGKSTLLNLLAGLDRVSSGDFLLTGESIIGWDEDKLARWRRENVGFIFQDFRLVPSFTALENVTLSLEILGWELKKANARAKDLLSSLGLGERMTHFPHQLSGGEQQRVGIARAFSHHPNLILADEPTGNLDPETSEHVMTALLDLNKAENTTLIMVTHDMDNALKMGRYVKMEKGKLQPGETP